MKKKIIVTGGSGRFGDCLKKFKSKHNIFFPKKNTFNILNINNMSRYLQRIKPDMLVHLAGLSRPMSIHNKNIRKSIDLNIVGTANLVKACSERNIKIIFFSTNYVYPGKKGNYKEQDALLPWNNYGWSKLGAESAVQMYKNSLIVRACMTERPFTHKSAFQDVISNFIFHDEFAKIFIKIIPEKGIINMGGKMQTIYNFAKKSNKNVKKVNSKGLLPKKIYMNLNKLNKLIK